MLCLTHIIQNIYTKIFIHNKPRDSTLNVLEQFDIDIINDRDNTHDRTVNELSKIYYIFLKKNTTLEYCMHDIFEYVNNTELLSSKLHRNLILNYLYYVSVNDPYITNLECSELDLLLLCWNRALIVQNKDNQIAILLNIFNNIVDFYINDFHIYSEIFIKKLCCISGRTTKLLSSFCHLDIWNDLGEYISTEMLKKEFLGSASKKYNDTVLYADYNNTLNELILEYDIKYHKILNKIKDELINSLIF